MLQQPIAPWRGAAAALDPGLREGLVVHQAAGFQALNYGIGQLGWRATLLKALTDLALGAAAEGQQPQAIGIEAVDVPLALTIRTRMFHVKHSASGASGIMTAAASTMIDDLSYIESYIKQRLPTVTVFQNSTDAAEAEIDVQNVPGKPLTLVRLLFSRDNASAMRHDPALADRLIATLDQALNQPSDETEALLDLRDPL